MTKKSKRQQNIEQRKAKRKMQSTIKNKEQFKKSRIKFKRAITLYHPIMKMDNTKINHFLEDLCTFKQLCR